MANPTLTNLIMNGHPDTAVLVVKQTSTALVKCYEVTFVGGDNGIFNSVIYNSQIKGLARSSRFDLDYEVDGTVYNDQIYATGIVSTGATFPQPKL